MMTTWNLIDAQDHLEELFQRALEHKPQRVEVGPGLGAVVVLSEEDYARMTGVRLRGIEIAGVRPPRPRAADG